jgi:tRNA A37 threonylcarbamoyltransferase TsaD
MIAFAGAMRLKAGMPPADGVFTVRPRWDLAELDAPA